MNDAGPARRAHPRLSFAGRQAPRLEAGSQSFEVIDLSPGGVCFRSGPGVVTIGDVVRAVIRFPMERSVEVQGHVLRVAGDQVAAQLEAGAERVAASLPAVTASPRRGGLLW